ncbi:uncharacterized protein JCM10292_002721 [Rhodotorula paludigena]|uniref:uncharacterized protein n=1 Tax=Rhodotorula paludigena TaxID=86838 RepID=UPI003176916C
MASRPQLEDLAHTLTADDADLLRRMTAALPETSESPPTQDNLLRGRLLRDTYQGMLGLASVEDASPLLRNLRVVNEYCARLESEITLHAALKPLRGDAAAAPEGPDAHVLLETLAHDPSPLGSSLSVLLKMLVDGQTDIKNTLSTLAATAKTTDDNIIGLKADMNAMMDKLQQSVKTNLK